MFRKYTIKVWLWALTYSNNPSYFIKLKFLLLQHDWILSNHFQIFFSRRSMRGVYKRAVQAKTICCTNLRFRKAIVRNVTVMWDKKGKADWPATAATSFAPTCRKSVRDRELAINCLRSWKSSVSRLLVLVPRTAWTGALSDMSTTRRHVVHTTFLLSKQHCHTANGHKTKAHAWNRQQQRFLYRSACAARDAQRQTGARAETVTRGRVGARLPANCFSPCMLQCTRLASANRGETTGDLVSLRSAIINAKTTNDPTEPVGSGLGRERDPPPHFCFWSICWQQPSHWPFQLLTTENSRHLLSTNWSE